MKKRIIFTSIIVTVLLIGAVLLFTRNTAEYVEKPDETEVASAIKLLTEKLGETPMYCDWIDTMGNDLEQLYGNGEHAAKRDSSEPYVTIDYNESLTYKVNVDKAGLYVLKLDYKPDGSTMSDFAVSVFVNGRQDYHEMKIIALDKWMSA